MQDLTNEQLIAIVRDTKINSNSIVCFVCVLGVRNNRWCIESFIEIIDCHKNWNILLFKEAIKMKEKKLILNTGLKASKELQLF